MEKNLKNILIGAALAALATVGVTFGSDCPFLAGLQSCGNEAPAQPVAGSNAGAGGSDDMDGGVQ